MTSSPRSNDAALRSASFDTERVLSAKQGRTVSVVLPARNEAETIRPIVDVLSAMQSAGVIDEVVVMNDRSADDTAAIARAAGARVVNTEDIAPELDTPSAAPAGGKGEALWKSLLVTSGDIVCWCDADVADFDGSYVLGLVGALLENDAAVFAKGWYARPVDHIDGTPTDYTGGRVTELVARPLIALLFPDLVDMVQPLAGEFAALRSAVETVPFSRGYAVDLALLIDLSEAFGRDALLQVDLGERRHRRQQLLPLGAQATVITAMALRKAGHIIATDQNIAADETVVLRQPDGNERVLRLGELPPMVSYRGGRTAPATPA